MLEIQPAPDLPLQCHVRACSLSLTIATVPAQYLNGLPMLLSVLQSTGGQFPVISKEMHCFAGVFGTELQQQEVSAAFCP